MWENVFFYLATAAHLDSQSLRWEARTSDLHVLRDAGNTDWQFEIKAQKLIFEVLNNIFCGKAIFFLPACALAP